MAKKKIIDDNIVPVDPDQARIDLLAKAKKDTRIDQREIFDVIPDTPENVEQLDAIYTELSDAGVVISGLTQPMATDFLLSGKVLKKRLTWKRQISSTIY